MLLFAIFNIVLCEIQKSSPKQFKQTVPAFANPKQNDKKQTETKEIAENKSELKEQNSGKIEEKQEVVASEEKEKQIRKKLRKLWSLIIIQPSLPPILKATRC